MGIKYELLAEPKPVGPVVQPQELKPKTAYRARVKLQVPPPKEVSKPAELDASKPKEKVSRKFKVHLKATAQLELDEEVDAENQVQARKLAEQRVRARGNEFSKAAVKLRVVRVKAMK